MKKSTSIPRSKQAALLSQTSTPPPSLTPTQQIVRITKLRGNGHFETISPAKTTLAVESPSQFRGINWRVGSYVLIDTENSHGKIDGEIVNIVGEEKEWRKMGYWPSEFGTKRMYTGDSEEEESTMGKMPPSDSEDEE